MFQIPSLALEFYVSGVWNTIERFSKDGKIEKMEDC